MTLFIHHHSVHLSGSYWTCLLATCCEEQPDFWRKGLIMAAWGDPKKLSNSDVLRFHWHSIGENWEQGLMDFPRARLKSSVPRDHKILKQVVLERNIPVSVVVGSKDRLALPNRIL